MFSNTPANQTIVLLLITAVVLSALIFLLRALYRKKAESVLRSLVFKRAFSTDIAAVGQEIFLTETVYNPTAFPLFKLTIEEYIFNDLELLEFKHDDKLMMQYYPSRFRFVLPHVQIKRSIPLRCLKRGDFRLRGVELNCSVHHIITESPAEIFVYPKPSPTPLFPFSANDRDGEALSRLPLISDPFSFGGIREYRMGDPFSSINFKATARSPIYTASDIKVNARDYISDRKTLVLINFSYPEENAIEGKIYNTLCEKALAYAAFIIENSVNRGFRAGFAANCKYENDLSFYFPFYSSRESYAQLMRAFSKLRIEPGVAFSRIVDIYRKQRLTGAEIYIFSLTSSEKLKLYMSSLTEDGNNVHLLIPEIEEDYSSILISEFEVEDEEEQA